MAISCHIHFIINYILSLQKNKTNNFKEATSKIDKDLENQYQY